MVVVGEEVIATIVSDFSLRNSDGLSLCISGEGCLYLKLVCPLVKSIFARNAQLLLGI